MKTFEEKFARKVKYLEDYHHWAGSTIGLIQLKLMYSKNSKEDISNAIKQRCDDLDTMRLKYYQDIEMSEEEIAFLMGYDRV